MYSASTPRTARRTIMRRASTRSARRRASRACTPGFCSICRAPRFASGCFEGGHATLETGATFTITTEQVMGTAERASTGYSRFAHDVQPGDRILLADGSIELVALASDGASVRTRVVSGGPIGDHKGINLPGVQVSIPSLTEKDLADLHFGLTAGVDMIALSFVRTADDVRQLRDRLGGRPITIVAKIEKPEGWENIESILDVTDGVMVARGDLGVEISLERVPRIQKSIIRRARRKGRFVITATQMLESMIGNPTPTRAEVSDVANAIYDGTDAVMLSAETSVGKYPVEAVRFMARIAVETEDSIRKKGFQDPPHQPEPQSAEILADAAHHAARDSARESHRGVYLARFQRPADFALPAAGGGIRHHAARHHGAPAFRQLRGQAAAGARRFQHRRNAQPDGQGADRRRLSAKRRAGGIRRRPARGTAGHHQSDEAASPGGRVARL